MNKQGQLSVIQEFLLLVDGHIVEVKVKDYMEPFRYGTAMQALGSMPVDTYMTRHQKEYISVEVDMERFSRALEELRTYNQLMRDPEARHLILEAEFIHKLKRGFNDY